MEAPKKALRVDKECTHCDKPIGHSRYYTYRVSQTRGPRVEFDYVHANCEEKAIADLVASRRTVKTSAPVERRPLRHSRAHTRSGLASLARLIRQAENARNILLANAYLFAEYEVGDEGPDSEDLAVGVANGLTEAIEALQSTHTEREEMVTALVSAARWLLDDMGDAGETRSEDGVEYDSCGALRLALEALTEVGGAG